MSMTGTTGFHARWSWRRRLAIAAIGLGLFVPLWVACLLIPDPSGRGTHRQLGLPPCTIVVLFGKPCPTCGMTTSWAHAVRGQLFRALRANVGGALLAVFDLAAIPWLWISAWRGRWVGWTPGGTAGAWISGGLLAVTLVDWIVRLCSAP